MAIDDQVGNLSPDIQEVIAEFNAQIGRDYFSTTKGSFDVLTILVMPDNTPWPAAAPGYEVLGMADPHELFLRDDLPTHLKKTRVEQVIVHEFGHVLGLGHSSDKGNVMYPVLDDEPELSLSVAVEQVLSASVSTWKTP